MAPAARSPPPPPPKHALAVWHACTAAAQVHHILDEIVMGGMVLETGMAEILKHTDAKNAIEKKEGGMFGSSPGKSMQSLGSAAKSGISAAQAKFRN